MSDVVQLKPIQGNSLTRWIIILGTMLLIALLFGTIPVLISYCKIMDA